MARHLSALGRFGVALLGSTLVLPSAASAQVGRAPDPNATRVMVGVFRAPEKNLGVQAADAMRSRMRTDFPFKQVYVLPKEEQNALLEASGFPTAEPLASHDAKALAQQLRVDEYVVGNAVKTQTGYRLEPLMVLTRDQTLQQPLGVHEGPNLTAAASSASKELREARKQIDAEKRCIQNAREQKWDAAAAAAKEGIAAYPKATLARICLARVMLDQKAPADELMRVAREIVEIDPKSQQGLRLLAQAYQDKDMSDSMVVTLTRLLQLDPTNAVLVTETVAAIARAANPAIARPIIEEAVTANPADPELLRLRWLILLATRSYREAFVAGEELIKLDTAMADTSYFITTAVNYQRDSQPQKAVEAISRGVAKFSNNATLIDLQIDMLRNAGQAQQALEVLDRASQANIAIENPAARRLILLRDLGRTEEILPAVRAAIAAGDTSGPTRAIAINMANELRTQAEKAKSIPMMEEALKVALFADSVATPEYKVQSQFILGAVYAQLGAYLVVQANEQKSCEMTKRSNDMLVEAQIMLPKGGAFAPDAMRALMNQTMVMSQNVDLLTKAFCK